MAGKCLMLIPVSLCLHQRLKASAPFPSTRLCACPTAPVRAPGIKGIPQPRLSLLEVLPIVPVEGSTYEYVRLDGYLSGAAYQVKEGDEKAEGQLPTKMDLPRLPPSRRGFRPVSKC